MNNIRFGCHKCGQRLACEPPSLGTHISCPACKQQILIPTLEIVRCYELFDLGLRSPMDEVRQAHLATVKAWHPDGFTSEVERARAAEKTKELNQAFETITSYLTGTYQESRARVKAPEQPKPAPESKPRPAVQSQPKAASPAPAVAAPAIGSQKGFPIALALGGLGVFVGLGIIVWLVMGLVQRQGPVLRDDSTGTQWVQAKEHAKRTYCHAVLVEMEQSGTLRKYGVRVNEQFFFDGLETMFKQKNPDDLNSQLIELSTKLVQSDARPAGRPEQ